MSEGDVTVVRWSSGSPPGSGQLRFLSRGTRVLDSSQVQNALADVVEAVITRLNEEGVRETPLHKEWNALRAIDPEEAEFCAVAGRLGLDPFSEGVDLAAEINAVAEAVEQPILVDFFNSAPPSALREAAIWVQVALGSVTEPRAHEAAFRLASVDEAVKAAGGSELRPWEAGYRAARRLRQALALEPTAPFPDAMPIAIVPVRGHQSFVGAGRRFRDSAAIATPSSSRLRSRFAIARTLWHAACSSESAPFLLTTRRAGSQSSGRAFAAELLAPAAGVRQLLGSQAAKAPAEEIENVAEAFGVASLLVEHQIDNQLRSPAP